MITSIKTLSLMTPTDLKDFKFSSGLRKYRCGQRTVRMAVVACSKTKQSSRAGHIVETGTKTSELVEKQNSWTLEKENARRCASRGYLLNIIVKLI
ncbi:hypothetical protein TNCV_5071541, partial [Trichonephila clavipes]